MELIQIIGDVYPGATLLMFMYDYCLTIHRNNVGSAQCSVLGCPLAVFHLMSDLISESENSDRLLILESPHVSQALAHQEKAVMSSERLQGIDHPQTIQDYVSPINPQTGNISTNPSGVT